MGKTFMITVPPFMSEAPKDKEDSSRSTRVPQPLQKIGMGDRGAKHLINMSEEILAISHQRVFCGINKCKTDSSNFW